MDNFVKETTLANRVCSIRDHRGNGRVERMVRTVNERLRSDEEIVQSQENAGLSIVFFAVRSIGHKNRVPNTEKKTTFFHCISDEDPNLQLTPSDLSWDADSTIDMRERTQSTSRGIR